MSDLKNRIAWVTGGSRGIGKAIALALAEEGAAVAVNYRERQHEAKSVVEAIRQTGGRADAISGDVSIAQAVPPGMRVRRWGRIVNISLIAGRGAGSISVAYNASKAGPRA
jgi:3-oxoacyl-[acyl-carrier protein] reductase